MKPVFGGILSVLLMLLCGCDDRPQPRLPTEQSNLKSANDVFWALDKLGYVVTKQVPNPSQHGCKPSEYLAKKDESMFRISVLHCGDPEQTRALVEDPKTRRVDALLRNHDEGGILQRGPLEIIVRMTQGTKKASQELLDDLSAL